MTPWSQGQVLRCGETTFQLIGEPIPQRNSPTLVSSTNDTMMSSTYMKSPVVSQPTPQPVSPPVQQYVPPSPSAQSSPNISPQINFQKQPQQGTFQPESATNNTSAIIGIIFGILMLIIGLVGWQHYQPQMNNFNSMLGQFTVAIGGDKVSRQFSEIKLYYTGSIVLACIGGIMVLASAIRLAVARK
jgi:predicted PurR-regulated permease PerM